MIYFPLYASFLSTYPIGCLFITLASCIVLVNGHVVTLLVDAMKHVLE